MCQHLRLWLVLISGVATFVAMPIWFFVVIAFYTLTMDDVNNASIYIYFWMLVLLSVPVAITNALVLAPSLTLVSGAQRSRLAAVSANVLLLGLVGGIVFGSPPLLANFPKVFDWVLLPYQLCVFLGVPIVIGTFVYSFFAFDSAALERRSG